jgi:hypothetical protein
MASAARKLECKVSVFSEMFCQVSKAVKVHAERTVSFNKLSIVKDLYLD